MGWRSTTTTNRPGSARELARAAVRAGCDRVVALGGDGTVSEVANGLVGSRCGLGIIPAGSGNDLLHSLGIPTNPRAAAHLAFNGSARAIDVGEIRNADGVTYFVNVASYGFDADVAFRAGHVPLAGALRYPAAIVRTLRELRPWRIQIDVDGRRIDRRVMLVAIANGHRYGGGLRIAPDAVPDDGSFDLCLVRGLSQVAVLGVLPRVYRGGHRHHPAVELLRCRRVDVAATEPMPGQADGEPIGALPSTITLLPGAILCVTPARPA
jgi:diacylglycerol kinase (ATP)